ncbi:MAG: methyltransferase domain-containing protein, partial [Acidobacteria bacterium]|nr:methyltransferase domain-containing protein [Acidobacteriota bacterium]
FPDGVFDRVLASFVLSHCPDYRTALADMVRVLRPGGRLGVTAWGVIENEFTQLWREIAESLIDAQVFAGAIRRALPWEDWFAEAAHLREALTEAGLIRIEVEPREYKTSMSTAEFLALREISVQARILREAVDGAQWERFRVRVAREFQARFRDPIEQTRHAHLAIGVRQRHGAGEKLLY